MSVSSSHSNRPLRGARFAGIAGIATLALQGCAGQTAASHTATTQPQVTPAAVTVPSADAGVVRGQVLDVNNAQPLANVVIAATSDALIGTQTAITDDNGAYSIGQLPPGRYTITYYYENSQFAAQGVDVAANAVTRSNVRIDPKNPQRVELNVETKSPLIDITTGQQGIHIGPDQPPPTAPRRAGRTASVTAGPRAPSAAPDPVRTINIVAPRFAAYAYETIVAPWVDIIATGVAPGNSALQHRVRIGSIDPFFGDVLHRNGVLSQTRMCFAGLGQCAQ